MLIRLSPEQLSSYWELIYRAIKSSSLALANMSEERINNILASLMNGLAVCWIDERGSTVTTVVITSMVVEPISETKSLLIYTAHMFSKLKSEHYIEMAKGLGAYATSLGCAQILVYCSNNKLSDLLVEYGADTFTLVIFPLH
jgi:hypothetical protein